MIKWTFCNEAEVKYSRLSRQEELAEDDQAGDNEEYELKETNVPLTFRDDDDNDYYIETSRQPIG